jgi:hypothetical protein
MAMMQIPTSSGKHYAGLPNARTLNIMNRVKKKEGKKSRIKPHARQGKGTPPQHEAKRNEESMEDQLFFDQTTEYIKDPHTGRWVIVNPAGSTLYNNLTREKKTDPRKP